MVLLNQSNRSSAQQGRWFIAILGLCLASSPLGVLRSSLACAEVIAAPVQIVQPGEVHLAYTQSELEHYFSLDRLQNRAHNQALGLPAGIANLPPWITEGVIQYQRAMTSWAICACGVLNPQRLGAITLAATRSAGAVVLSGLLHASGLAAPLMTLAAALLSQWGSDELGEDQYCHLWGYVAGVYFGTRSFLQHYRSGATIPAGVEVSEDRANPQIHLRRTLIEAWWSTAQMVWIAQQLGDPTTQCFGLLAALYGFQRGVRFDLARLQGYRAALALPRAQASCRQRGHLGLAPSPGGQSLDLDVDPYYQSGQERVSQIAGRRLYYEGVPFKLAHLRALHPDLPPSRALLTRLKIKGMYGFTQLWCQPATEMPSSRTGRHRYRR